MSLPISQKKYTIPDLSAVRMIVTDMDGTLLDDTHAVPNGFFDLANKLIANNIVVVAASGRQYNSIAEKLQPVLEKIYVIAENGGITKFRQQELDSAVMVSMQITQILDIALSIPDAVVVLCGKKGAYIQEKNVDFVPILTNYYSSYHVVPDLYAGLDDIMKIAVYHPESSEKHLFPALKVLKNELSIKVSAPNWLDCSLLTTHKGVSVQMLQQELQISTEETLAFGDYHNDLEMLANSKYSFAMANAHPDILKAATYQTDSNNQKGVIKILNKVLEDKKIT